MLIIWIKCHMLKTCVVHFGGRMFLNKWIISEVWQWLNMVLGTPFYFGQIIGISMEW
jgi:hypothetical protein